MDYSQFGYTNRLRRDTALKTDIVTAVEFESKYEVQNNKINASKINLGNFVKQAGAGTALGTFNLTQALNLTTSITYNTPKINIRTFGLPLIGIYQGAGTLGSNQIYPIRGGSVTLGRYDVIGGVADINNYTGTSCEWRAMIVDTNGTSGQVITFAADWIYTDYVTGAAI